MSFSEKIRELDREIGDRVERALADVRRELAERLRRGTEEILLKFEEVRPELPASLLGDADVTSVEHQVRSSARRGGLAELREALAGVDRARSQGEILNALLAGSDRFSSRAAVLLARGGELRGWGARGFPEGEPAIREVSLVQDGDGGWSRFAEGRGVVRLSAMECAALCSRLESPLPQEGVLVPLVLRDRVAAALYADTTGGDELAEEALQVLAYVAAQAIETLPFRERASTPTLYPAEAASAESAAAAPAPEPAPAAEEPPPVAEEPRAEALAAAAAPAAGEAAAESSPASPDTSWAETAATPMAEPVSAGTGMAEPESAELPDRGDLGGPAEPDVLAQPEAAGEEPAPASWGAMSTEPAEPAGRAEPAEAAGSAEPAPDTGRETVLLQRPLAAVPAPEPIPSPFAPAREEATPAPEESAPARPRPVGFAPAPEPEEGSRGGTVEVQPPSGVQGPGWAFATTRVPVSPDEETLHDEARRLARLLVSEIKLYNEDQVDEGRRNRDLYERLKEDIDRSRQMYEERVDPRVLRSTDYFYQELVRILAGGDSKALGV